MKKSSKLLLTLSLMGLGVTALASCESSFTNPITGDKVAFDGDESTSLEYSITNTTADYAYLDGLPEKGEAGKSYTFRVSLKPGYHFNDKVTITAGDENVAVTQEGDKYTFVMPSADILIRVDCGQTNFTITNKSYFVEGVYLDDESEEPTKVTSAIAGTPLKFEAVADIDFSFTKVTINGKVATVGEDGYYHFNMPVRPVVIDSDKNAIAYDVNFVTELKQSTVSVYKLVESETEGEAPTKVAVEKAIKGETIYVEFTAEIEHMEYGLTVKTAVDESETPEELKVTPVGETGKIFSFTMISSDIEIEVKEDDRTLYYTSPITGKTWKGANIDKNVAPTTKKYSEFYSSTVSTFEIDGSMKTCSYSGKWTPTEEGKANLEVALGSAIKNTKAAWTTNILAIQFTPNASWLDAYFCLADDTHELHYYSFDDSYRVVWIQDEEGNITESIVIKGQEVYLNPTIKLEDEEGTAAKGDDINATSNFSIYDGEALIVKVESGVGVITSNITVTPSEYVDCKVLDADGNEITSSANKKKVTLQPRLKEGTPSRYSLRTPVVKDASGAAISVTSVANGDDTDYTFTMPVSDVTITIDTKDAEKYKGYSALGDYYAYNLYGSRSGDQTASILSTEVKFKIAEDGTLTNGSSSNEISEMTNANDGMIKAVSSTGSESEFYFGDGIIVTPFNSSWNDVWVGVRVPEGHTKNEFTNNVHYRNNGTISSWAMSVFFGDDLLGSVFCFEGQMYTGVAFTFDEGSTRISETSSYHVVKDGVTLFDVKNNVFTKAGTAA